MISLEVWDVYIYPQNKLYVTRAFGDVVKLLSCFFGSTCPGCILIIQIGMNEGKLDSSLYIFR